MKRLSTTLDFSCSVTNAAKKLLVVIIAFLPFISWGQQQQGTQITLPESYQYFGGDSLKGFDIYAMYNQLANGGTFGKELAILMYKREKQFIQKKYNLAAPAPHFKSPVSALQAHGGQGGRPKFTIDWDEMNKINAERAKHFQEARIAAYGEHNEKKPFSSGCGNLDMGDASTNSQAFNNWSGEYAFNGDDVPGYGAGYILYYPGIYPAGWEFNSTGLNGQEVAPPASNKTPITKGLDASAASSCSWVTVCDGSAGIDPCSAGAANQFNEVCPGFNYSLRLGGAAVNLGPGYLTNAQGMCGQGAASGSGNGTDDDPEGGGAYTGQGEFMTDSILITNSNCLLTINFAGVLNTGGNSHTDDEQPWGGFQALSAGVPVNCLYYFQQATGAVPAGYTPGNGINPYYNDNGSSSSCYFIPWTPIAFDCHQYIGKYIALQFFAVGCQPGAHFAYFYFDVSCGPELLTVTNPSCGTGTITGPPGAASYKWTGPCVTSGANSQVVTVGCSGTYTLVTNLTGTGGCNDTIITPVTINSNPTVTANATSSTICSAAGGTTLNAGGAGAGGTYIWQPGGLTGASVSVNPPVGTTTYTVTGKTSGLGCTGTATVAVTVNATPTVTSINVNPSPTVCAGTPVSLSANGSSGYVWTSSGAPTTPTTGTTVNATPTTTTTYSVTATVGGCTSAAATTTITVNPTPTATASAGSGTICAGQSTQLTAAPSGLSYSWTPNVPVSLTNTSYDTTTASPTVTTVYTVIVTDANGCTNSASPATVTVNVNGSPTVSVSSSVPSDSICSGNSITLTANGSAGYMYSWSPGGATTSSITVSPTTTTTYVVTASTSSGCSGGANATATAVVTVTPTPTLTVGPSASPGICPGDSLQIWGIGASSYSWSTGATTDTIWVKPSSNTSYTVSASNGKCPAAASAVVNVSVGTLTVTITSAHGTTICSGVPDTLTAGGAVTYVWSTGATTSSIIVNPSTNDTISVIGTSSGSGCSAADTIRLAVNTTPTVTSVSVNDSSGTVCPGDTTQAFVKDSGVGPYTYLWTPGGQTHDTAYGLTAGTYTVTVASANGCAALTTNTVTIKTQNIVVTATASGGGNICTGGSPTQLTATGANNYIWRTSAGLTDTIYDTTMAFPAGTTTYTVYGTTKGTCKDSATVTVTVNSTPTLTLNVGRDTAVCSGGSITLTASGATGYSWNTTPVQTTSSITVSPSSLTTYVVTGTGAGGCTATDTITVNVVPSPTVNINISGGNDTVCKGSSVTLTASGAPGNNYVWSPGGSTGASIKVTPATSPTTYTVTSTNGGCSVKTTQDVYIFPALNVNMLNAVDSGCSGQSVTIGANVSGGSGPYAYVWSPNVGTGAGPYVVPAVPQTYTCTVTDACGSTASGTTLVIVTPSPTAKFNPEPADSVLAGGYISFVNQSTNATWYYWTFGDGGKDTSSFPYYQYNVEGTYTVTLVAVSKAGCRDTVDTVVHVKEWIFIPNVFTPNGDGINDVFHVTAASMKTYHIEIFNRWGERLFQADNPNIDWNGRSSSGVMESDGIYYYKITATDYAGHNYNLDGYVQLIGGGNVGGGQ